MYFLLKPDQYSASMVYHKMDAASWNRLIANPMIMVNKDYAPLSIWGTMTTTVELAKDGNPRCIGDNVEKISALQVDFDDGYRIEDFQRDYHRYSYQLYTSYNHGFKPSDRFRAIFPLAEPIYTKWLVPPVKDILHNMFDRCDVSCFDKAHWQILPVVRSIDAPYYFEQHGGTRLSFKLENFGKIAMEYSEDFHWKREIADADRDPNANHSGALKYVQDVFDKTEIGSRDRVVYSKLMFLKDTVGCTYDEVIGLRPPVGFDAEYVAKVNRLYLGR